MSSVGIVTIQSNNFGNRLQNYALETVIRSIGYDVQTIKRTPSDKGIKKVKSIIKIFYHYVLNDRESKFHKFNKLLSYGEGYALSDMTSAELSESYDYFITGSDQVWNPYYDFIGSADLLAFAPSNKRIAYAASFGVQDIPEEKVPVYAENLQKFKVISVREEEGAVIVKRITGKDAQIVLDPTLLFSQDDWTKIEKRTIAVPKNPYVLVYSLGEKNDDFKEKISELSDHYEIFDITKVNKNGKKEAIGPAEFIYLIHHAYIILTDSFHASVFSILYHKKFITFNRPGISMNSRIKSLASIINAKELFDINGNWYCDKELDYSLIEKRISIKRKESIGFIKKSLEE